MHIYLIQIVAHLDNGSILSIIHQPYFLRSISWRPCCNTVAGESSLTVRTRSSHGVDTQQSIRLVPGWMLDCFSVAPFCSQLLVVMRAAEGRVLPCLTQRPCTLAVLLTPFVPSQMPAAFSSLSSGGFCLLLFLLLFCFPALASLCVKAYGTLQYHQCPHVFFFFWQKVEGGLYFPSQILFS